MRLIKAAVIGGVVLFMWSAISWMALPWHNRTFKEFRDTSIVTQILLASASESGVYLLKSETARQPFAFIVFKREGYGDMKTRMILALLEDMLAVFAAAWLLHLSGILGLGDRVRFVALLGLFAGLAVHLPNAIWWGHSVPFTLVEILDGVAGWTLVGLSIAKFV